jgi:hypothetical protein
MKEDPQWIAVWDDMPDEPIDMAVMVKLKSGEFRHDIGVYHEESGWNLQFWKDACVVAFQYLPRRLVAGPQG